MKTLTVFALLALALSPAAGAGEPAADDDPAGKLLEPLKKGPAAYGQVAFTLLTAASGKDEAARKAALEAIDRLGPFDAPFARNLASALNESKPELRLVAARSLTRVPSSDLAVLQALANQLGDRDPEMRAMAIRALSAAGTSAKASWQVLGQMLSDQDPRVRCEAAAALGRLGSGARPMLQGLINLTADKEADVRRAAVRGLGRTGEAAGLQAIVAFAGKAADEADREAAYSALLELGEAAAPARDFLRRFLYERKDKWDAADARGLVVLLRMTGPADQSAKDVAALLRDDAKKRAAAAALARAPAAAAAMADALAEASKDPKIAADCARALGKAGRVLGGKAAPALVALLDSEDDAVSAAALRALGDVGDLATAPEVVKRAEKYAGASQIWLQYARTRLKQEPDRAMGRLRVMGADPWALRRQAQLILSYLESGGRNDAPDFDD